MAQRRGGNGTSKEPGGVLVGNWYEERCTTTHELLPGALTVASAAPQRQHRHQQQQQQPSTHIAQRSALQPGAMRTSPLSHAAPGEAAGYFTTLNCLSFVGDRFFGMPRVQDSLFTGRNKADAKARGSSGLQHWFHQGVRWKLHSAAVPPKQETLACDCKNAPKKLITRHSPSQVPVSTLGGAGSGLAATKRAAWIQQESADPWATSSRAAAHAAALAAAEAAAAKRQL
jgi:hypothetical protein